MSFSWNGCSKLKKSAKKLKPSPTCQSSILDSARNPVPSWDGSICRPSVIFRSMKGISLFASLSRKTGAGMTVEASIVLPLFLFFFLNLGCAIELIRLHGNLELALWQIGSKLSVYGYTLDSGEMPDSGEGWWRDLAGRVFSATYVKAQVIDSAGEEYLNSSPLTDGAGGLQLWESKVFNSNDEIDILVTYSVSPWSRLVGFFPFRMANRYYAHVWNGYRVSGTEDAEKETQTVYVTETGTVYHLTTECTHLQLSVHQIATAEIEDARNQNGGRYRACTRCAQGNVPSFLYITEEGDRYHYSRDCSGLRRTVSSMALEEALAAGYRACSRCGR